MADLTALERHVLHVPCQDFAVRAVVLVGRDQALVWDALASPEQLRPAMEWIGERDVILVYSHADWDHVLGASVLPAGRRILAQARAVPRLRDELPGVLRELGLGGKILLPDETFEARLDLRLDDCVVYLRHLPGHSPDSCVAWLPEEGVLLAGDAVEWPLPEVWREASLADLDGWIAALAGWEQEPGLRRVIPSHGPEGGTDLLAENRRYLERLRAGETWAPPGDCPPFYRDMHAANLRWREGVIPVRRS